MDAPQPVLNFTKDPSRKTLRPLIELYGRDRDRMKVEAEILERKLEFRLAHFDKPDDALVRKVIVKNEKRVLAVRLHIRSGYGNATLVRFFKVPRTTAYGWLSWFQSLPEGLRDGILAFMDSQAHGMAAYLVPAVMPNPAGNDADSTAASQTMTACSRDLGQDSGRSHRHGHRLGATIMMLENGGRSEEDHPSVKVGKCREDPREVSHPGTAHDVHLPARKVHAAAVGQARGSFRHLVRRG